MQHPFTPLTEYPDGNYVAGVCKRDYRTVRCGRFVWPAASAQLQDMRCPNCGDLLEQTTRHSKGAWFLIGGDTARAIAAPRKRARAVARKAKAAVLDGFRPEPERGTQEWYRWRQERYMASNHAFEQAFTDALQAELAS